MPKSVVPPVAPVVISRPANVAERAAGQLLVSLSQGLPVNKIPAIPGNSPEVDVIPDSSSAKENVTQVLAAYDTGTMDMATEQEVPF